MDFSVRLAKTRVKTQGARVSDHGWIFKNVDFLYDINCVNVKYISKKNI